MRVLVVKMTSMGDLVQTLPALTDALGNDPAIRFDWVADRTFAEIAAWHPGVERVIASAHRDWRKAPLQALRGELPAFRQQLRERRYDLIIDAQANLKSAVVSRLAAGERAGMDAASVREYGAHWAYQRRYPVAKDQHAIARTRQLFAQALGYRMPDTLPDFRLPLDRLQATPTPAITAPFLVFMQHATWTSKLWQTSRWRSLCELATASGYTVVLPWGDNGERQRSEQLASGIAGVTVLPRLTLNEVTALLLQASGCVSTDTGLAHIAASLDTPTVTLYGSTDPQRIGATGGQSMHLIGSGFESSASGEKHKIGPGAESFWQLPPLEADTVWNTLYQHLS